MNIDSQIACVKAEVRRRKVVFPILVEKGKMDSSEAILQQHLMQTVLETLTQLKGIVE